MVVKKLSPSLLINHYIEGVYFAVVSRVLMLIELCVSVLFQLDVNQLQKLNQ